MLPQRRADGMPASASHSSPVGPRSSRPLASGPRTAGCRVRAERTPGLSAAHPRAAEDGGQAGSQVLCPQPAPGIVRQPPEREHSQILRGDDKDAEPGSAAAPSDGLLPRNRAGTFDVRVHRQEAGPGHAVLRSRPGRAPQRTCPRGSRSSRAPTRRRNARICGRDSSSRIPVTSPHPPRTLPRPRSSFEADDPGSKYPSEPSGQLLRPGAGRYSRSPIMAGGGQGGGMLARGARLAGQHRTGPPGCRVRRIAPLPYRTLVTARARRAAAW